MTVRGGGHNVAGRSIRDGLLLLDLSKLRHVSVNRESRVATVQGGALWRDVDKATAIEGLATTGGLISSTGVGGFTLGGGRRMADAQAWSCCDNVCSAGVVLADGRFVRASPQEHADLYWGLRGGAGGLGVVTSFDFNLHPLREVLAGLIVHPAEHAGEALRAFRDYAADAPDEFCGIAVIAHGPPLPFLDPAWHGRPLLMFAVCWCGDAAAGRSSAVAVAWDWSTTGGTHRANALCAVATDAGSYGGAGDITTIGKNGKLCGAQRPYHQRTRRHGIPLADHEKRDSCAAHGRCGIPICRGRLGLCTPQRAVLREFHRASPMRRVPPAPCARASGHSMKSRHTMRCPGRSQTSPTWTIQTPCDASDRKTRPGSRICARSTIRPECCWVPKRRASRRIAGSCSAASLITSSVRIRAPSLTSAWWRFAPRADRSRWLANSWWRNQKLNRGDCARCRICSAALKNRQACSALPSRSAR